MNLLDAQRAVFASELGPHEKLVALALLNHWSRASETFPSVNRLVDWTSLHRTTIMKAIQALEGCGVLVVTRTTGRANRYELGGLTGLPQRPVALSDRSATATPPVAGSDTTGRPERPDQSLGATRSDPGRDPGSSRARTRARGQRPILLADLLNAKVTAHDWSIPEAFVDYASELGLSDLHYADVLVDFREKITRPAGLPWLASQLCRFIEQKAKKLTESAAATAARTTDQNQKDAEGWA